MKKLELTESPIFPGKNHKDMLLEMCNDLIGKCYWNIGDTIGFPQDATNAVDVHWVEVCLVHLPKVLATNVNWDHSIASRIASHVHEFYYHPKHMVDYLYQEYQNNTIWKKTK
jgi:hypothetical protein